MSINRLHRKSGLCRCRDVKAVFCVLLFYTCTALTTWNASGQSTDADLRIIVRQDNESVYLYHTAFPAIGHGFNVYRKRNQADEFEKINADPIRGVTSGTELRAYLGTLYDDVEHTTGQSNATGTLTKLRSDIRTANLLTFTYPLVAEALGRLFIDSSAPIGQPVTYRAEFVDALDTPTGVILDQTLILLPQKPAAPSKLRAQNTGNRITLFWQYPTLSENADDKVIRFEVYRVDPTTGEPERLNQNIILRNDAIFEHAFTFEVPTTGQTEQLYVRAIDISGQSSPSSEILRYETVDQEAPNAILDVQSVVLGANRVQVQWSASETRDIAGYNLYRSSSLSGTDQLIRLNTEMLRQNETTYNDTLVTDIYGAQTYFYRVTALDIHGNEGPLSTAALAVIEDRTAPQPPVNVQASVTSQRSVELSWDQPVFPEDFSSFIVLRQSLEPGSPNIPSRIHQGFLTETSLEDLGEANLGFKEGAQYKYQVMSADLSGNYSSPIELVIKIPDRTPPESPGGVEAIVDNASRITLLWNPSPSTDVMSYIVYRSEVGSTQLQAIPLASLYLRYEDTQVQLGKTYEYWLTSADYAGNESAPTRKVNIQMRDYLPPRSVRNVQAILHPDNKALIQWEKAPSPDLAGYRIYRSASIAGQYRQVHNLGIDQTTWTDDNSFEGAWYKIFAIDTSGNESPPSYPTRVNPNYTNSQPFKLK